MRRGVVTILFFLAATALATSLASALTGGMSVPSLSLSVRDPLRPLLAGLIVLAVARALTSGVDFAARLRAYAGVGAQRPARVAGITAVSVLVFSLAWTSRAAGGSDSSCYVLQAEAFAHGRAALANPVAAELPGLPNAVFAPIGFVPSPRAYGDAVPICAPGLALAMAAAYLVHPAAVFAVVPVSAALLVWLTFVYGRRLDDEVTGAWAALLVACSPIFLYQAVQPMSDVPAAAAWMAALVSASPIAAGVWMSIAILIRPNLALLAVPLLLASPVAYASRRNRVVLTLFVAAMLPGMLVLLALNAARYGGPLATGYGSTDALFAWMHVEANLTRYARWLIETQTPFVLLALAAPWAARRDPQRMRLAVGSLLAVVLLAATYLAYTVFDDWWYIRFLLPALPILLSLAVTAFRAFASRLPRPVQRLASGVLIAIAVWYVQVARARHVLELQGLESRFARAGEYAARSLPANAVVLAVQESGSVRFHGRRDTIAWDAIPPDRLDATVLRLGAFGRVPFLALEEAEEPAFRLRFAGEHLGALDFRPDAEIHAPVRVRFYSVPPGQ